MSGSPYDPRGWPVLDRPAGPGWVVGLALVLVAWTWLFGNAHQPGVNGDEASLLNVPYRVVEHGEVRYPAFLSDAFGSDELRRFPPLSSFWLRTGFHSLFGVSAVGSRTFSALLVGATLLIGAAALRRLTGVGPLALAAYFLLAGLATPVIAAARSFRNEQEVLFLGVVGTLLLPMLQRPGRSQAAALALWLGSGLTTGVAAASHPWGACYVLALGSSLLFSRRSWHERDGLGWTARVLVVGAGVGLGALPSLVGYLVQWEQAQAYMAWQRQLYSIRELEMVPWMSWEPPWGPLRGVLGPGLVARLNALDLAAFSQYVFFVPSALWLVDVLGYPARAVFYLELLAVVVRVGLALRRRESFGDPIHPMCLALALVFPAFFALYPPNLSYGVYAGFHVHLGFCLTMWAPPLGWRRDASGWQPASRVAGPLAALQLLGCVVGVVFALGYDARVLIAAATRNYDTPSLDQELGALSAAGARAGFLDDGEDPIYTSIESWMAAGRAQRSIIEPVVYGLSEPPRDARGAVFKLQNMDVMMVLNGGQVRVGLPILERARRLEAVLAPIAPRELILGEVAPRQDSFWLYARTPQPELHVSVIRRDGTHGLLRATELTAQDEGSTRLPAGRYLLLLRLAPLDPRDPLVAGPPPDPEGPRAELTSSIPALELEIEGEERPRVVEGFRLLNSIVPMPVPFELPAGETRVRWRPAGKARFVEQRLFRLDGW